jgi:drug/metabolite transporter (DMT)-like permease
VQKHELDAPELSHLRIVPRVVPHDRNARVRRTEAMTPSSSANLRLGSFYALVTSALLATQEPFSALAAKHLNPLYFVCITQAGLLFAVPLLTARRVSRHDFAILFSAPRNWSRLALLFVIGCSGLALYNLGLRNAHPIIIAAILNLSPFWAALVARFISRKAIPISPFLFCACFFVAFVGAMLIAWSQIEDSSAASPDELVKSLLHGSWKYAIPIPIFFALSGTLVGHWFRELDESATMAANFIVSAAVLIPGTLLAAYLWSVPAVPSDGKEAVLLLLIGTLSAAAAGRVFYQVALTVTDNDNGFVTMFFLLVPALSSLISLPLSWWIPELRFAAGPMFFGGLALVAASLFVFSSRSW